MHTIPIGCFCRVIAPPDGACLTCTCPDCGATGRFGAPITHREGCSPEPDRVTGLPCSVAGCTSVDALDSQMWWEGCGHLYRTAAFCRDHPLRALRPSPCQTCGKTSHLRH